MFDWLGLSPEATTVLGYVFIALGAILLISLGIWIVKSNAFGNPKKVKGKTKSTEKPKISTTKKEQQEQNIHQE